MVMSVLASKPKSFFASDSSTPDIALKWHDTNTKVITTRRRLEKKFQEMHLRTTAQLDMTDVLQEWSLSAPRVLQGCSKSAPSQSVLAPRVLQIFIQIALGVQFHVQLGVV